MIQNKSKFARPDYVLSINVVSCTVMLLHQPLPSHLFIGLVRSLISRIHIAGILKRTNQSRIHNLVFMRNSVRATVSLCWTNQINSTFQHSSLYILRVGRGWWLKDMRKKRERSFSSSLFAKNVPQNNDVFNGNVVSCVITNLIRAIKSRYTPFLLGIAYYYLSFTTCHCFINIRKKYAAHSERTGTVVLKTQTIASRRSLIHRPGVCWRRCVLDRHLIG